MAPAAIPAWVIYTAAAASVASAAATGYSAYSSGQAQKNQAGYNAKVAEAEGEAAEQKAEYDAEQSRRKFKAILGEQVLNYSKAGVDITSGSPLLLLSAQAKEGERERQEIMYEGKTWATRARNQARIYGMTGNSAYRAGQIGAGSSFLSGVANAGSMIYGMKK
jgi:hypothetical protein